MKTRPSAEVLAAVAVTVLAALLVAASWRAQRATPPGAVFAGSAVFLDDYLQYLSFAEQARGGAFLLGNKFDARAEAGPALVNLTWWLAGVFARAPGLSLDTAFRIVGVLATLGAALATAGLVRLAGGSALQRALGVLLVGLASGSGWLSRLTAGTLTVPPDAGLLLFPSSHFLLSAHAAAGTALLLAGLLFFVQNEMGRRSAAGWIACGTLLGLTRPFDLAVLAGGVFVALAWRRAPWRSFLPLAALLPVLAYDAWIYGFHPSLGAYGSGQNVVPGPGGRAWIYAIGAPVVAAVAALARRPDEGVPTTVRRVMVSALGVSGALVALPIGFSIQFSGALGALLLVLVATSLPSTALAVALAVLLPGTGFLVDATLRPAPNAWLPADYAAAADALRPRCRTSGLVVGPIDPSLYVAAHTPCRVLLGHRVLTPRFAARIEEVRTFYAAATPADVRRSWLARESPRFVLAPPGGGATLLEGTTYRPLLRLQALEVWTTDPG